MKEANGLVLLRWGRQQQTGESCMRKILKDRRTLTDRLIRSLKQRSEEYTVWDTIVPSLGIRVLPSDVKTFILGARFPGKKHYTRRALGGYGELTIADAREKARKWLELIERGIDPQTHEELQRQAEERQRQNTFAAVAEAFIKDKLPAERKGREVARDIRREFISVWGDRPITDIAPRDIREVVRAKAKTAKPQARNLLGYAKRMFAWAVDEDCYGLTTSPASALKPSKIVGEKISGDRILDEMELFAFFRAAKRMGYPHGVVYLLLLYSGLRLNEVADAHWREFDLPAKLWVIPKERMKAKNSRARPHAVPLTDEMLAVLQALPRFADGGYLFSTDGGKKPTWMSSKVKHRLDQRMLRTLRALAGRRGDDPTKVRLRAWKNHDVRRSVRSNLSRLKVSEEVREAVMAHVRPGIKGVYDLHDYLNEKAEALQLWAARLRALMELRPDNVVMLKATPRR
jgi:integrase